MQSADPGCPIEPSRVRVRPADDADPAGSRRCCSAAVVAIATRAFRAADRVSPSLTVSCPLDAESGIAERSRPVLTDLVRVEHVPQRALESAAREGEQ